MFVRAARRAAGRAGAGRGVAAVVPPVCLPMGEGVACALSTGRATSQTGVTRLTPAATCFPALSGRDSVATRGLSSDSSGGSKYGPGRTASGLFTGSGVSVQANSKPGILDHRTHPYLTGNARYLPGFSIPAPRRLEQLIKYALLEREDAATIREIWSKFHGDRQDACATVFTKAEFEGFQDTARRHPYFVYPVPKGDGNFFTLISQWQAPYCIFSFLDDYRKDPTTAEPWMAVTFYDDFATKKDVVLVRGDFSGHLTKEDAIRLLAMLRHYYLKDTTMVEVFNKLPDKFDFQRLLQETT